MNVSSVNAVGGACYIRQAGCDMSERVRELEELCEQQQKEIERLTGDIEHFKEVHRVELEVKDQELRKTNDRIVELENILTHLMRQIDSLKELDLKIEQQRSDLKTSLEENRPEPVVSLETIRKPRNFNFRFTDKK